MLAPRPSTALEYWFFKVNAGPVALLVDWIARRKQRENVLRVSIHSPHQRAVVFDRLPAPMIDGQNFLTTERTVGKLGDTAWELDIECGPERVEPGIFPSRLLRMSDLDLVSAPVARFTGWVRHGPLEFELRQAPGMLAHYWGRQLLHEWWWLSANQFDRKEVAFECAVLRTSLWGSPVRVPLAYVYLRRASGAQTFIMSPPALARATGTPEQFEIEVRPLAGKPITLKGQGREYGDLGDGILNTLVGDLEVWEGGELLARAEGSACFERRAPQLARR